MSLPITVRGRLTVLLLIAAIPLCLMAGFIALQNYRIVARHTDERVMLARTALETRYNVMLERAAFLLDELAQDPSISDSDRAACARALDAIVMRRPRVFDDVAFVLPADGAVCHSGTTVPFTETAMERAVVAGRNASGLVVIGATSLHLPAPQRDVVVASSVRAGSRVRGVLIAGLAADLPVQVVESLRADGTAAWLLTGGDVLPIGPSSEAALPEPSLLAAIVSETAPREAIARGGVLFDYAATPLLADLELLVATPAGPDIARAEQVLTERLAELGLLSLAGLILVAIGANFAVVEPLKLLTQAVRRWRGGGAFNPGEAADQPREIQELSASFREAVAALSERERQLRLAITQQDLLMQEIHHRVKNNLQIIASLMNLQASRIRQPEAKAEFQSARDRIRALATLHRHLYAHGELHTINMRGFLTELCGQLLQAIGETPSAGGGGRIRLQIEAPELQISSDQAVPMALIVTEAVSNAAKYAFPAGRRGSIEVRLTTEGDTALLVIEDDGVGIPAGRAETETGIRDGIGIQLIRGFARQLGGTLTVTEYGGTRYALTVKLRRARVESDPVPEVDVVAGDRG